jgi:hypothetical protein
VQEHWVVIPDDSREVNSGLTPGNDGDPLPPGEWVIRVAKTSKYGFSAHQSAFELSSKDKESAVPRLSVWAEKLTTDEQAWRLTGSRAANDAILRLDVDSVRLLLPTPRDPPPPHLEVEWESLMIDDPAGGMVRDPSAGAIGHAGIRHLRDGTKEQYKSLRIQLAEMAEVRRLPEDLLREGVTVAG